MISVVGMQEEIKVHQRQCEVHEQSKYSRVEEIRGYRPF
jgi:hypothetical protein